jgi:tetratricopeptide (TPR) repeat protein
MEKQKVIALIATAVVLFLTYVHFAKWGEHALSIPVMRLQQVTGILSAPGYEKLAAACIRVNKWSCAENALLKSFEKSKDPAALNRLAILHMQLGQPKKALVHFESYFKAGGDDGKTMLAYAKLLELDKKYRDALKYYNSSIASRPDVLPVEATGGIVRILIKEGRYRDAYAQITSFHKSAENAKGYFNTELAQLKPLLRKGRTVASN